MTDSERPEQDDQELLEENQALRAELKALRAEQNALRGEQNALRGELEALRAQQEAVWPMLTETSRRLQVSSAAIKASVSSLLNYDIFWDAANQHEFLETIDTSVDQVGRLITLLALAFRLEAGTLVLKLEPQILQEIIFVMQAEGQTRFPNLAVRATLPKEGHLVQVDYQYLTLALVFLLEALEQMGIRSLHFMAQEEGAYWRLACEGLSPAALDVLKRVLTYQVDSAEVTPVSGEYLLRLQLVCRLLKLQGIQIEIPEAGVSSFQLSFLIPAI